MTPTPEQQSIIDAATGTKDNLIISALAGAAKTTTLEMLTRSMRPEPTLSLAFNKRIADEMARRLPGHVAAATMNAIGHRVWASTTGRRLVVDTKKVGNLLKVRIDALPRAQKTEAYDQFGDLIAAVRAARVAGYVPASIGRPGLIDAETFFAGLEDDVDRRLIDGVIADCIRTAMEGNIDFDDQIYMSALFSSQFPIYPLVLVDEAQDLSPLNHAMLDKLVRGRIIAVGDPNQSIYAFRGAVTTSMDRLRSRFDMRELGLSVSFRCPRAVVRHAHRHVPHMKWADWAEEGLVETHETHPSFEDGATIICRNNAPLLSLAFKLIRSGRGVTLPGFDIGPGLARTIKKLGPESMSSAQLLSAIDSWEAGRIAAGKAPETITDKAECLRIFARQGKTLGEAAAYAESIFKTAGPIQLMSGHKAKGLEWDNVYHLDPWRIPSKWARTPEDFQQEANVDYVITTRAKRKLGLFDLNGGGDDH